MNEQKHIQIIYKNNSYEIDVKENDQIHTIITDLYYHVIKPNTYIPLFEKLYIEMKLKMKMYSVKCGSKNINYNDVVNFDIYNLYI